MHVAYTYDARGRQLTEASGGKTHAYTYDLANNRITVTYNGTGTVLTSTYDVLNRLHTLSEQPASGLARVTTYGYDLNGNRVFQQMPNGEETDTTFDALNRQTGIVTTRSGGGSLLELAQAYDLAGNLVKLVENHPGSTLPNRTITNGYDRVNRLVSELNVESGGRTITTTYGYDAANNRTSRNRVDSGGPSSSFSYTFNNLNQLTQASGSGAGPTTYGYDAEGNRISSYSGYQGDDYIVFNRRETYAYDQENRLVSMGVENGPLEMGSPTYYGYTYDYRTRRVERTEAGVATRVVFSGGVSVAEYAPGTPAVTTVEYMRGSDWGGGVGGLLYTVRAGSPSFKHYNSRGDVVVETDAAAAATWQAHYEAFGTRVRETGTSTDRQKANTKEEDPTGLLNEGFRYRDLETGVFITRDPLGFVDGPNMYAYVVQNPWSKFDPLGLKLVDSGDGITQTWAPDQSTLVCHGSSAFGFNGNINSFSGLTAIPGSGPRAAEGYSVLKDASIGAVAAAAPVDMVAAPALALVGKGLSKIPGKGCCSRGCSN